MKGDVCMKRSLNDLEDVHRQPKVVFMCGKTGFRQEYQYMSERLTLEGHIVISSRVELTDEQKESLRDIHLCKMDMADEIFILNVGGYIGESTKWEIQYAIEQGKSIHYYDVIDQ
jgi:hypothetical protein